MSVTGNKMRTDCSPCRRRFRYRRIRWDTWEQERADGFESVLISSPRKWGLRVAHNALSLRQAPTLKITSPLTSSPAACSAQASEHRLEIAFTGDAVDLDDVIWCWLWRRKRTPDKPVATICT